MKKATIVEWSASKDLYHNPSHVALELLNIMDAADTSPESISLKHCSEDRAQTGPVNSLYYYYKEIECI